MGFQFPNAVVLSMLIGKYIYIKTKNLKCLTIKLKLWQNIKTANTKDKTQTSLTLISDTLSSKSILYPFIKFMRENGFLENWKTAPQC